MIVHGDALEVLKTLPDESVDCVVTSPPYWALRDYGVTGQLGLEPTFQEYITKLCDIFDEVRRVLKKEGTCWVNIGDTYGGSGKGAGGSGGKLGPAGKQTQLSNKGSRFRFPNKPQSDGDVSKSLCQIPSRFAIEMTNRGWILRNEIIWFKPNCMPSSVKDRFTVDFEKVFFFVKNKKYWFETQYEPHAEVSIKARGAKLNQTTHEGAGMSSVNVQMGDEPRGNRFIPEAGRNKRCVWKVTTKPFKEAHFATYPEALIEPMIQAGCPMGGVVLDPFFGAGTTGLVAKKQGKNYVGIEINKEYIEIAERRIAGLPPKLFEGLKQDNAGNPTYTGFNKRWKLRHK